jgi:spore coat protein U-like protein
MRKILLATLTAGVMSAGVANALTTVSGGTITVTATVNSTCSASSTNLAFPAYTPGSGAKTGTATVNVKCTKNTGFTVALDKGANGTFAQRLMANGANTLEYNVYTTVGLATIFGDGTGTGAGATATVPGTGTGVSNTIPITVYGSLPDSAANQLALPGTYTDTINVSVSY